MRTMFPLVIRVVLCLSMLPVSSAQVQAPQRLSEHVIGQPIVAQNTLLWLESAAGNTQIVRFDRDRNTRDVLVSSVDPITTFAATTRHLVWLEAGLTQNRLLVTELQGGTPREIGQTVSAHAELALDGDVLLVADTDGLSAFDLDSFARTQLAVQGQRPVALDRALLWSEEVPHDLHSLGTWRLFLRKSDAAPLVVAEQRAGYGGFVGYTLTASAVFYAFAASGGDPRLFRYDRGTGQTTSLSQDAIAAFSATDDAVVWVRSDRDLAAPQWLVERRDARGIKVVLATVAEVSFVAYVGDNLVVGVMQNGKPELWLLAPGQQLPASIATTRSVVNTGCNAPNPIACGQVRISAGGLIDDGGTWTMRGVQFFLPQFGINGKTFWDRNYASAAADGSLDYWLDRSRNALNVNMLRLFVDLPNLEGDTTPTSYVTVFDFAARAASRGMRIGISLHNSADWQLTPTRAAWITGLIDYFAERNSLALIAYLNADNEINNHCGNGDDCFDTRAGFDAQTYIDGAVGWTIQFRALVQNRAPILVTAGISSEVRDYDQTRAAFDFFRADTAGRTLAQYVDFLAPHNYSGGADSVIGDVRANGYSAPIVLEEYGYPTDPQPRDPYWTEGPPSCRAAPLTAECRNTAAFFVETNLLAMRTRSYSGGAAWMLADMDERSRVNGCNQQPFDLWTGLLTTNGLYCDGGTTTRGYGAPKATAVRVCINYGGATYQCAPELAVSGKHYLPLIRKP